MRFIPKRSGIFLETRTGLQIIGLMILTVTLQIFPGLGEGRAEMAAPVIPNEGLITGKVLSYAILSSEILSLERKSPYENRRPPYVTLFELRIYIENSENLEGMRNFTEDKVGSVLTVYTKEKVSPDIFNQRVKARISLEGDEWGKNFWIRGKIELLDH